MPLGLTAKELNKMIVDEIIDTSKRRKAEQKAFAEDLIKSGVPEIEAKKQALYHIRHEATIQAVVLAIQANNIRIQYQLEQKGIEL